MAVSSAKRYPHRWMPAKLAGGSRSRPAFPTRVAWLRTAASTARPTAGVSFRLAADPLQLLRQPRYTRVMQRFKLLHLNSPAALMDVPWRGFDP